VVQAHGINADLTEGGMFTRLAERLAEEGFTVLRFSYRGHGRSGGTQRGVTIAGEMLDFEAAVNCAFEQSGGQLSVVAASFGAVSTALSLPWLRKRLFSLVLWNPVLDLDHTFVNPHLPWGQDNYSAEQQQLLRTQGYLMMDGEFELGRVLFEEFSHYQPANYFRESSVPALVVHGDRDTAVSYDISRRIATDRPGTALHTIHGSDHGFDSIERENEAIAATVDWLINETEVSEV
jgi:alpha-beta hydrolase superfamily lysophospholipase